MTEPVLCPQCGSEIPAGSPAGLCPKCLVLAGLESELPGSPLLPPTKPSSPEASSGFVPPTVEEVAARFSQLEILGLLGRGGMGAVYKARQRELDRRVAVKILPPEVSADPAFAERFTREARALARLSHPNIVAVYDFGRTGDGQFYFVMEYVDGVNLRQAIQLGGMTPKDALAIVPQICDALQFAHDEGIVHRDIKPENILIDKKGRVKIADFGLAKLLGQAPGEVSLTATQQVMGTLRYMAPEQLEGTKAVDHRADIYSLGVVFYELLTGELPIGRFAPPSKKVQIDVRLDEVVLRALEKEPEQRYQHASEVKTDVETISGAPGARRAGAAPTDRGGRIARFLASVCAWQLIVCLIGLIPAAVPVSIVDRGVWGIGFSSYSSGTNGVDVRDIQPGSLAYDSGLRNEDRVLAINGMETLVHNDLSRWWMKTPVGAEVEIRVVRAKGELVLRTMRGPDAVAAQFYSGQQRLAGFTFLALLALVLATQHWPRFVLWRGGIVCAASFALAVAVVADRDSWPGIQLWQKIPYCEIGQYTQDHFQRFAIMGLAALLALFGAMDLRSALRRRPKEPGDNPSVHPAVAGK